MSQEITIAGIGIAPEVLTAIVSRAVEEVEGIASVGVKDLATNLVSMFSTKSVPMGEDVEAEVVDDKLRLTVHLTVFFGYPFKPLAEAVRVEAEVVDDKLRLTVHLTVFFGYPFKPLAEAVRVAVANAIDAQVGVEVECVNICIDSLVFPKE